MRWQWINDFIQGFFTLNAQHVGVSHQRISDYYYLTQFHVILEDDTLWGWGDNSSGLLGDGTTQNRSTPVLILDEVFAAARGVALRHDGTFWTWGMNHDGRVGDGTTNDSLNPVMIMDYVISAPFCVCAEPTRQVLRADGTLWTWGPNREGQVGDGTTEYRLSPVMILDNVFSIMDGHGGMALKYDGLWAWGMHRRIVDGASLTIFDSLSPQLIESYSADDDSIVRGIFTTDEGEQRIETIRFAPRLIEYSSEHLAQYIYTTLQNTNMLILLDVHDIAFTESEIIRITAEQLTPDMLNIATLYIENVARRGTSQPMPSDGLLSTELLRQGVDVANQIRQSTYNTLITENFTLMRRLRTNINFISKETQELYIAFPDDISTIPFDNVTVESEFASVTINHSNIRQGREITIRRVPMPAQTQTASNLTGSINTIIHPPMALAAIGAMATTPSEGILSRLATFWSIPIIALIIVGWLVLASRGVKIKTWIAPTLTVVLACAKVGTFILGGLDDIIATHNEMESNMIYAIEVTMTEGMRATISLPANGDSPEFLIMFNEHGELQHSKYNPVTGNIDANIRESGIYFLREQAINFADIDTMHQRMQDSILRLAARNIMRGTDGGYFHPNDLIQNMQISLVGYASLYF